MCRLDQAVNRSCLTTTRRVCQADNSVDNSAQVDQSAEDVASIVVDVIALLISITSLTVAGVMLKLYRKLTRTVMANDQVTCESVASFATEFRSSTPIQMGRSDENMNTYLEPRVYVSVLTYR